eukprot:6214596-Pyramimonas_sp.AAC.1
MKKTEKKYSRHKALRTLAGVKCHERACRYSRAPGYLHDCRPVPPQSMHWLSAHPASGYPGPAA